MSLARVADGSAALLAISFDFANTLVPVRGASFAAVVELTVDGAAGACGISDRPAFLSCWAEERDRQFREDVPLGRKVSLPQRVARVLARLRGMPPPGSGATWDDSAAERLSAPAERDLIVDLYTRSFVRAVPPPPAVGPMLHRLRGRGYRLGILSNWPLSVTIERYVEAAGWAPLLAAVVVSERVGAIKPSPLMFATAERELGVPGAAILHIGDDWTADVVGARMAGWRAAYLRGQPQDWPRQPVDPGLVVEADLTIDRLEDLEAALEAAEWGDPSG